MDDFDYLVLASFLFVVLLLSVCCQDGDRCDRAPARDLCVPEREDVSLFMDSTKTATGKS